MGLRKERLADEIRDLLALSFSGGQMSDPLLAGVCITHVRLSADLQVATVYYRSYEDSALPLLGKALSRCSGLLRSHLASNLRTRRVPQLRFFYDESVEYGSRIEKLLGVISAET